MNQAATLHVTTAGTNDFVLTDADFNRIRELVREHTGIALSEAKRQMVYGRLARRLRALRLASFADYVEFLERAEPLELQEFTNAITTNLTSFFRESHHFDYLAEHVLPQIAARAGAAGRLRIWSCACSTGEEPYSIAMVLRERRGRGGGWSMPGFSPRIWTRMYGRPARPAAIPPNGCRACRRPGQRSFSKRDPVNSKARSRWRRRCVS